MGSWGMLGSHRGLVVKEVAGIPSRAGTTRRREVPARQASHGLQFCGDHLGVVGEAAGLTARAGSRREVEAWLGRGFLVVVGARVQLEAKASSCPSCLVQLVAANSVGKPWREEPGSPGTRDRCRNISG